MEVFISVLSSHKVILIQGMWLHLQDVRSDLCSSSGLAELILNES